MPRVVLLFVHPKIRFSGAQPAYQNYLCCIWSVLYTLFRKGLTNLYWEAFDRSDNAQAVKFISEPSALRGAHFICFYYL